jgi:hypothetical protein
MLSIIIVSLTALGGFIITLYTQILRPRRERRRIAWIEIENELNKLVKLVEEAKPLGSIPPGRNWRVW